MGGGEREEGWEGEREEEEGGMLELHLCFYTLSVVQCEKYLDVLTRAIVFYIHYS